MKTTGFIHSEPFLFRTHWQYAGGTPTATQLSAVVTTMHNAMGTQIANAASSDTTFSSSTLTDLASATGAQGFGGSTIIGSRSTPAASALNAIHVKFGIARRYRGGHPGVYLPPAGSSDFTNAAQWNAGVINSLATEFAAWVTACLAASSGTLSIVNHVNVSYYEGFTVVTDSHGRAHNVPKLRSVPLVDVITTYTPELAVSTQRRRGGR